MGRIEQLTKFVSRDKRGIEIGPWCHPLVPKRQGNNVLILDVFDTTTLRQRAAEDPGIPDTVIAAIEEVDLVGSSTRLAEMIEARGELGTFDYIVSSHNFEHLPDPVRFLRGCEAVLKPGGVLSMAIPDKRGCFDYYRPQSSLAQILAAYFEKRDRPTPAQVFERWSLHARLVDANGVESISFPLNADPLKIKPFDSLKEAYRMWQEQLEAPDLDYRDTHCWVFTPATIELILADLRYLGLIAMTVSDIESIGNEIIIHLCKTPVASVAVEDPARDYEQRRHLMRRTQEESVLSVMPHRTGFPMSWVLAGKQLIGRLLRG